MIDLWLSLVDWLAAPLAVGALILIGQALEAGDRDRVRQVAGTTLSRGLLLALMMAVTLIPGAARSLRELNVPSGPMPNLIVLVDVLLGSKPISFVFLLMLVIPLGLGDADVRRRGLDGKRAVQAMADAGELNLTEADAAFDKAMGGVAKLLQQWFGGESAQEKSPAKRD